MPKVQNEIVFPTVERIEEAFFEAMRHGYAAGVIAPAVKESSTDIPGMKRVIFVSYNPRGDLRVVDQWTQTPCSDQSNGFTLITWNGIPVWIMHYGGWYKKEVAPFLKKCLLQNYITEEFRGGRGPESEGVGDLLWYANRLGNNTPNTFESFSGEETIMKGNEHMGSHWYRGDLLISG